MFRTGTISPDWRRRPSVLTRLPLDSWAIEGLRGPEWPDYKVGPLCALQGCSRINVEAHHITRRSFMTGPYCWVRLPDGTTVGNLLPLCWQHHQEVTENRARIVWDEQEHLFWWRDDDGLLRLTQPPTIEAVTGQAEQEARKEANACPTCGQRVRPKFEKPNME